MIAIPNGGLLPPAWRRGRGVWSEETKALAREYAKDGLGESQIVAALWKHGVAVSRDIVHYWLHPERNERRRLRGTCPRPAA